MVLLAQVSGKPNCNTAEGGTCGRILTLSFACKSHTSQRI